MFKAIAKMRDDTHEWTVTIISHCKTFMEAEKAARKYAYLYAHDCIWIQILNDDDPA